MTPITKFTIAITMLSLTGCGDVGDQTPDIQTDSEPKSATAVRDLSLRTETISEGLHVLMGKRAIGNVVVSIGEDGTFLIDDQFDESEPEIRRAIQALGGTSPEFVINSHYHHDHAGGNEAFGKGGAIITAHDNTRKLLEQGTEIKLLNLTVPPAPKSALPIVTFAESMNMHLNGNHIRLTYLPNAHTETDIAIHMIEANVIHLGDVWNYTGNFPFIDSGYGGTLAGMIAGQTAVAEMADDNTVIIPGHGPLANKAELIAYTQKLADIYDILVEHAKQGHNLEEVIAAKPVDKVWKFKTGIINQDMWLKVVYPAILDSH